MTEQSLVIIKPDGVKRQLVGKIIQRFEEKGLTIEQLKMDTMSSDLAREHYAHLSKLKFFEDIVSYMTSGPVVYLVLSGDKAIETIRLMIGETNPLNASPGTIRGDYALTVSQNVIHASDSIQAAHIEIQRFFT